MGGGGGGAGGFHCLGICVGCSREIVTLDLGCCVHKSCRTVLFDMAYACACIISSLYVLHEAERVLLLIPARLRYKFMHCKSSELGPSSVIIKVSTRSSFPCSRASDEQQVE